MNRMLKSILNIGCAAEDLDLHATRLAISGNDSRGGGSATELDEEDTDEKDLSDRNEADPDLDDDTGEDDTRSRRSRQDLAYDEIKSDRDRLKNELETQKHEAQEFRERLARIEGEKSARQETNARTNANLELVERRSREIVDKISKLDPNDPQRSEKVYRELIGTLYEDMPKFAEEVSRQTSRDTVDQDRRAERALAEARRITLEELDKAGLDPEDFELVEALAIAKGTNDPEWFKRVKSEDQIPELVDAVKERIIRNSKQRRNSQEFQDEKREHRRPMNGVIERGSTSRRSVRDQDEDEEPSGKGSILADMKRIRMERLKSTNRMLRQADNYR